MIRLMAMFGVVVVAGTLLGFPYLSWAVDDADYDTELSLGVTAVCNGYLQDASFTHTQSYDELLRESYWEYLDGYWSFSGDEELPPYPYLSVIVQVEYYSSSKEIWRTPYTYGETLDWSGTYATCQDDMLLIELHIVHEKGHSSMLGWKEIVP